MLRFPHFLDSRLTDGGKVVSLTQRPRSTPQKRYFSASGTRLCWKPRQPKGLVWLKVLGKLKKSIHLIWCGTRDGTSMYALTNFEISQIKANEFHNKSKTSQLFRLRIVTYSKICVSRQKKWEHEKKTSVALVR
jgi:hypothetical protein